MVVHHFLSDIGVHRTIMTIIVYGLANYYTYCLGTSSECHERPLRDVLHDMLPDWSKYVYVRDVVMLFLLVPILLIKDKFGFFIDFWEVFMIVVLIKAVCIFFTFVPPSNPDCKEKKYLNHCYHSQISGHAAFVLILAFLYIEYGLFSSEIMKWIVYVIVFLYCVLILVTRAHYTTDVISSIIVTWLLLHRIS